LRIAVIAAIGRNRELGKDGKLPWHIKEDLKRFREITMGNVIVMGRKTYESLPGKLDGRTIIVLTTQTDYNPKDDDVLVFHSVGEIIMYCYLHKVETMYCAGGGEVYKHFLPLADQLYLTKVDASYDADTYFEWNENEWINIQGTLYEKTKSRPALEIGYYERTK
jgi:dihydrofolate reductase